MEHWHCWQLKDYRHFQVRRMAIIFSLGFIKVKILRHMLAILLQFRTELPMPIKDITPSDLKTINCPHSRPVPPASAIAPTD